ncbi:MAG: YebC/PmpR family DNA-binding transcriptional regulator [Pseudomonadota bacterium]
MAGHSKFKNIMHRKGAQDAKRAKIYTKIGREITISVKTSGPDAGSNPRLRAAIINARASNMPNDRIKRAMDAGLGSADSDNYVEVRYEGYGPGGVAIIVDTLTDNKNRTAGDVRAAFSKYDGNLGETNSVNFMFDRVGEILYPLTVGSFDAVFEAAVEAGADDCAEDEAHFIITTSPNALGAVRDALHAKLGDAEKTGMIWRPLTPAPVTDEDIAKTLMKLIDVLEDNDDVQEVTTNLEMDEQLLAKLGASS